MIVEKGIPIPSTLKDNKKPKVKTEESYMGDKIFELLQEVGDSTLLPEGADSLYASKVHTRLCTICNKLPVPRYYSRRMIKETGRYRIWRTM